MINLGRRRHHGEVMPLKARTTDAATAAAERTKPVALLPKVETQERILAAERRVRELEETNRRTRGMYRRELDEAQDALAALRFTLDSARPADVAAQPRRPLTLADLNRLHAAHYAARDAATDVRNTAAPMTDKLTALNRRNAEFWARQTAGQPGAPEETAKEARDAR